MRNTPAIAAAILAAVTATTAPAAEPTTAPTAPTAPKTKPEGEGRRKREEAPAEVIARLGPADRHWDTVRAVAFRPDGKLLASGSEDGSLALRDPATGRTLSLVVAKPVPPERKKLVQRASPALSAVAWSPDGRTLATAGGDQVIRLWDFPEGAAAPAGEPRLLDGHDDGVISLAWSADGRTLLSVGEDRAATLWDAAAGKPVAALPRGGDYLSVGTLSADGRRVAVGGWDGSVRLRDGSPDTAATGAVRESPEPHLGRVTAALFAGKGGSGPLITAGFDGAVVVRDPATGVARKRFTGHDGGVLAAAVSADGSTLFTAASDGRLRSWSLSEGSEGRPGFAVSAHDGPATALALSPDGKTLATGGTDGSVRLWDGKTGSPLPGEPSADDRLYALAVAVSPDSASVVTGHRDGGVTLWDAKTGKARWSAAPVGGAVQTVAFAPAGDRIAVAGEDGVIRLRSAGDGRVVAELAGHRDRIAEVAFSPDGRTLISGSADKSARLWDLAEGKQRAVLGVHDGAVTSVAISSDGRLAATASEDRNVRVFAVADGKPAAVLDPDEDDYPFRLSFAGDGRTLATSGNRDATSKLWDAASGKPLTLLAGHAGRVEAVSFAAGSRDKAGTLVSAGGDGTVRVFDPAAAKLLKTYRLRGPRGLVRRVAASPDGRFAATVNGDGSVWLIRLDAKDGKDTKDDGDAKDSKGEKGRKGGKDKDAKDPQ